MLLVKGMSLSLLIQCPQCDLTPSSILEYLSREDAERAVKELDGRDLRGQPVRVAMDREVCTS